MHCTLQVDGDLLRFVILELNHYLHSYAEHLGMMEGSEYIPDFWGATLDDVLVEDDWYLTLRLWKWEVDGTGFRIMSSEPSV
jgi:hypothetical protein